VSACANAKASASGDSPTGDSDIGAWEDSEGGGERRGRNGTRMLNPNDFFLRALCLLCALFLSEIELQLFELRDAIANGRGLFEFQLLGQVEHLLLE